MLPFFKVQGQDPELNENFWQTDGEVYAIAQDEANGIVYIGGDFRHVGPPEPHGASIGQATGAVDFSFVNPNGAVWTSVPDGNGGWYIGGDFTEVGGVTRNRLAQIDATGQLTAWNPSASSTVTALAVSGSIVYAGGGFGTIGGQGRPYIAAIDATSGIATGWNPGANALVRSLAVSGSTVYAGGDFFSIGGQSRSRIAAIDVSSGNVTPWNPSASSGVYSLAVSGSIVYAGGSFTSIGGQSRNRLAAIDAASGNATVWNPSALGGIVRALVVSGSTVYAGGDFTSIGGQSRSRIAAIDASSGSVTPWNPSASATVYALAVSGSTVYAGGDFTAIGGQNRLRIAAINASSGNATAWNPSAIGRVRSLAVVGTQVYAGGDFGSIGAQSRNNIAAINASSGQLTAWNPSASGRVYALAVLGSTVYAGGEFNTIGGQNRNNIAAIAASSGNATAWDPNANNPINALAVSGSTIYAGGAFTAIGGQSRNRIAAIDAASGNAAAWNPSASSGVLSLAVSGSTVFVGGQFTSIGGQSRNRIAAIDASSGNATAWNPSAGNNVNALAVSGSTVYAGGDFTSIGGQSRSRIAAIDAASGNATAWNPSASSAVLSLAVSGSTVYAGGLFSSIGGQSRNSIAAIDAVSGNATAWNPSAGTTVFAIAVSGSKLYVGGDFLSIDAQPIRGFAAFDLSPCTITPACTPFSLTLSAAGTASLLPANVDNGSSVACGPPILSLNKTNFDCSDIGTQTVTLTVSDSQGNSASCQSTVTILQGDFTTDDACGNCVVGASNAPTLQVNSNATGCGYMHVGTGWDIIPDYSCSGTPFGSSFDTDAQGWTLRQPADAGAVLAWFSGSNNGFIRISEPQGPVVDYFKAPAAYLGDKSGYYGGILSFSTGRQPASFPTNTASRIRLVGAGISLTHDFAAPGTTPTPVSIPMEAGNWKVGVGSTNATEAQLRAVLTNVQELNILADWSNDPELVFLDNVLMTPGPARYTLTGATSGAGHSLDGVIFNLGNTKITWRYVDNCGVNRSCQFSVNVTLPTLAIAEDQTICPGETTTITAAPGSNYNWSNGATTQSIEVGPGTYTVTLNLATGCTVQSNGIFIDTYPVDACGECYPQGPADPNWNQSCADCNATPNGSAFIDNCLTCVGGSTGLIACTQDCNGVFGGTAFLDDCGTCVGGNTGQQPCIICAVDPGCGVDQTSTAYETVVTNDPFCCNNTWDTICQNAYAALNGGPSTAPECIADCNGVLGGSAFLDDCGTCVGGNTGQQPCITCTVNPGCGVDQTSTAYETVVTNDPFCCNNAWDSACQNAYAALNGGPSTAPECIADCNGVLGGSAFLDNCGTCVGGSTGQTACTQDCNGEFGGSAFLDNCGTCVGGSTGQTACTQDCNGVFGGTALPGTACNDGNGPGTFDENCNCQQAPCTASGGLLSAPPNRSFCVGTGSNQTINIAVSGASGTFQRWGLFGSDGALVASRSANSLFNLDGFPSGNYTIRYMRYEADTDISQITGLSSFATLQGCFGTSSNAVPVFLREEPSGGLLSALTPTTLCPGAGAASTVQVAVSGATGQFSRYGITSQSLGQQIVASNTTGIFDLDDYAPGTYRVAHLSFHVGVVVSGISFLSELEGCYALSNNITITVLPCVNATLSSQPNPTGGISWVSFSLPEMGHATLEVYDLSGRLIRSLYNANAEAERDYRFQFDASHLPNGVYLYRLTTAKEVVVDKFILAH